MQYGRPVSRSSLGASYGSMPRLLTFENNVESSSKFLIKINIMTFSITKLIGVDYLLNIIAAILYATRCRLFGGRSVCNEMESGTDRGGGALRFCLHGKDVCEIQIGIIKITHQEKLFDAEEEQSFRGAKAASVLVRLFLLGEKIVRTHTQRFFSLLTTS